MLIRLLIGTVLYVSILSAQPELFSISSKEQSETFLKLFGINPKTSDKLLSSGVKLPFEIVSLKRDKSLMSGFLVNADASVFDISILKKNNASTLNLKPSKTKAIVTYHKLDVSSVPQTDFGKITQIIKTFESKSKKKVVSIDIIGHDGSIQNIKLPQKIESLVLKGDDFVSYVFSYEGVFYDVNGLSVEYKDKELPVDFERVSDFYSMNRFHPILHKFMPHYGIDLAATEGKPVYAVMDGIVSELGYDGGIGNYVKINHQNGYETLYGHLSKVSTSLTKGGAVHKKDVIGLVGHTGLATGPHLHFGVKKDGVNINPSDFYGDSKRHVASNGFFEFVKDAKQRAIAYGK
jgi:murein DD-endopeptidase MepM/ murein hydrolase activator NlpD